MRLSVSHHVKNDTGWGIWLRQLCDELTKLGVTVVDESRKSDLHLAAISGLKPRCPNVLIVNGIYYDKDRFSQNNPIRRSISCANFVVFQSKWSSVLATRMLDIQPKNMSHIWNGADQRMLASITPCARNENEYVFCACASWRDSKRPEAIIDSFLKAKNRSTRKMRLRMVGDHLKKTTSDADIEYFGKMSHSEALSIVKSSDCLIHICHIDACPGTVIEALSLGKPVVCNNIGGTPELVGDDGVVAPIDKPFSFKVIKSMKDVGSKAVDTDLLASAILSSLDRKWNVNRPDLDISITAKKYMSIFRKVLR